MVKLVYTLIVIFIVMISPGNSSTLNEIELMALNVYHEARGEPLHGQLAVMRVVINRINDPRFPNTIHGVILQRNNNMCQFSWVCKNTLRLPTNDPIWDYILTLSHTFMSDYEFINDNTNGALYFRRMSNRNNNNIIIHNHIFYR